MLLPRAVTKQNAELGVFHSNRRASFNVLSHVKMTVHSFKQFPYGNSAFRFGACIITRDLGDKLKTKLVNKALK